MMIKIGEFYFKNAKTYLYKGEENEDFLKIKKITLFADDNEFMELDEETTIEDMKRFIKEHDSSHANFITEYRFDERLADFMKEKGRSITGNGIALLFYVTDKKHNKVEPYYLFVSWNKSLERFFKRIYVLKDWCHKFKVGKNAYFVYSLPYSAHVDIMLEPYEFNLRRGHSFSILENRIDNFKNINEIAERIKYSMVSDLELDTMKSYLEANKYVLKNILDVVNNKKDGTHGIFNSPKNSDKKVYVMFLFYDTYFIRSLMRKEIVKFSKYGESYNLAKEEPVLAFRPSFNYVRKCSSSTVLYPYVAYIFTVNGKITNLFFSACALKDVGYIYENEIRKGSYLKITESDCENFEETKEYEFLVGEDFVLPDTFKLYSDYNEFLKVIRMKTFENAFLATRSDICKFEKKSSDIFAIKTRDIFTIKTSSLLSIEEIRQNISERSGVK
jgi:hypothetical protein